MRAWLSAIPDRRDPALCYYGNVALLWTAILMFMGRLKARRQIKYRLNTPAVVSRLEAFCGQPLAAMPHGDTVENYLSGVDPSSLERLNQEMVRSLLEARRLESFRFLGLYYLVVVDMSGHLYLGTEPSEFTKGCLTQQTPDGRTLYYRPVCEGKLVTRTGLALSMGSEFVENPQGWVAGQSPQDCELSAAQRLFPRLKAAFPGFAFCALLDSRYCNETGFRMCEENHWPYVITFKEGSLPSVWEEFQTLQALTPENRLTVRTDEGRLDYTWLNGIPYGQRTLNVLCCVWTKPTGQQTTFAWVTDIPITAKNCHPMAEEGGRQRWKIENEGFRTQKHAGFAMEHAYAKRPISAKNFYFLLQVAYLLAQMFECYCRGKGEVKRAFGSLQNLAADLLESLRRDPIPAEEVLLAFLEERIQIRLNTS